MKKLMGQILVVAVLSSAALFSPGCATGGGGGAKASGPVELQGTQWKLVALGGRLDGRVIEFTKRGADGYLGKIIDLGRRMRDVVGVDVGFEMLALKKKGPAEYEGIYRTISAGTLAEKEVMVFVDGDSLSWNQESAVWERIK